MEAIRKLLDKCLITFCVFLFMFMTVIGTYQIVTRYFFNSPSTISEELVTYSFTWLSILAAAMDAKKAPDLIQMTVTIPSMKCSVVFIDGVLTSYPPIPGVSTRLQNVTYGFKFSRAQRLPL